MLKKTLICLSLIATMVFGTNPPVQASASRDNDIVRAKKNLVSYAKQQEAKKSKAEKSRYNVEAAMSRLMEMVSENKPIAEIASEMNESGIYILGQTPSTTISSQIISPMSDSGDIHMSRPIISLNTSKTEWIVTGGGWWTSEEWKNEILLSTKIGGPDGFGVGFTSTSGAYTTRVLRSYATISDDHGHKKTTSNRSDGNGELGFGFRIQDYVEAYGIVGGYKLYDYVGKHFAGQSVYDSKFVNYDGVATTYYIHTWNSASISGIDFGVSGKSAGVNAKINNSSNSFICYSADTRY